MANYKAASVAQCTLWRLDCTRLLRMKVLYGPIYGEYFVRCCLVICHFLSHFLLIWLSSFWSYLFLSADAGQIPTSNYLSSSSSSSCLGSFPLVFLVHLWDWPGIRTCDLFLHFPSLLSTELQWPCSKTFIKWLKQICFRMRKLTKNHKQILPQTLDHCWSFSLFLMGQSRPLLRLFSFFVQQ